MRADLRMSLARAPTPTDGQVTPRRIILGQFDGPGNVADHVLARASWPTWSLSMGPPRFSAKFDERSRTAKAQKIAMLSGIVRPAPGATMLYFGSGSDYIASLFLQVGVRRIRYFRRRCCRRRTGEFGVSVRCSGRNSRFQTSASTSLYPTMSSSILRVESSTRIWLRSVAACATMATSILPFRTAGVSSMPTIDSPSWVGCRGSWPMAICD
jgi:hypothetical protein